MTDLDHPATITAPLPLGTRGFFEPKKLRQWVIDAAVESFDKKLNTLESKNFKLRVKNLSCDNPHFTLAEQHHAILHQNDLTVPLKGTVELIDKNTGEVKDTKNTTIARIPWITPQNTSIISGNSYVTVSQARLKPGVYTRVKRTGEPEAHINVQAGTGLGGAVTFDPATAIFSLKSGSTHTKLYGLLRDMGVSDTEIQKAWGHEVWLKNKAAYKGIELDKLHSKLFERQIAHEQQ